MDVLIGILKELYSGVEFSISASDDDKTLAVVTVNDESIFDDDNEVIQISDLVLEYTDFVDVEVVLEGSEFL